MLLISEGKRLSFMEDLELTVVNHQDRDDTQCFISHAGDNSADIFLSIQGTKIKIHINVTSDELQSYENRKT